MTIIAIDPGGTTGTAVLYPGETMPVFLDIEGRDYVRAWLKSLTTISGMVIVEDYIITPGTMQKSRQYDPLLIIGFVEGWAEETNHSLVKQTPSQGKSFGTNDKLRRMPGDWYKASTTPGGHSRDAARHLLTYTATKARTPWVLEALK